MPHRFDRRLRRLEQQAPATAWLHSEGLAAGPPSGLRRLLEEARQSRQSMVLGS